MIKKTIKYFLYFLILVTIGVFYLSYYGVETNKFNQIIKDKILENNSNIDIELNKVKVILNLRKLKETHRFMKGLFSWVGYNQFTISFDRPQRKSGQTKWGYKNLFNFAIDGITSFSTSILRLSIIIGFSLLATCFIRGILTRSAEAILNAATPNFSRKSALSKSKGVEKIIIFFLRA